MANIVLSHWDQPVLTLQIEKAQPKGICFTSYNSKSPTTRTKSPFTDYALESCKSASANSWDKWQYQLRMEIWGWISSPNPVVDEGIPASPEVREVIRCQCKAQDKKCSKETCSCHKDKLCCTSYCNCAGGNECFNPHTPHQVRLDEENEV